MLDFLFKHRSVVASLVGFLILMMWVRSGIGLPKIDVSKDIENTPQASNALHFPTRRVVDLPASILKIRERIIAGYRVDRAGDLLLYQTTAYEIEYITGFDFFFVNITGGDPNAIKTEAEGWFKNFGLAQEDLCDLPLRFLIQDSLMRGLYPGYTTLPTGCST